MPTICLVSCSARKLDGRHPAKDLYASDLFCKSRCYAEHNSDRWFILSAKYGLLRPDDLVESYNVTLQTMPIAARREWTARVFSDLQSVLSPRDRIVSLAGERYMEFLIPNLEAHGVQVSRPMEGLRIGEQLRWLKRNTL
jgi:cytoplasmic iron level regulating protein YaaA (DUF328/UPF0246 family)